MVSTCQWEDDGEEDQTKADQVLLKLLTKFEDKAEEASEHVLSLMRGHVNQRQMLKGVNKALLQVAIKRTQKCQQPY